MEVCLLIFADFYPCFIKLTKVAKKWKINRKEAWGWSNFLINLATGKSV